MLLGLSFFFKMRGLGPKVLRALLALSLSPPPQPSTRKGTHKASHDPTGDGTVLTHTHTHTQAQGLLLSPSPLPLFPLLCLLSPTTDKLFVASRSSSQEWNGPQWLLRGQLLGRDGGGWSKANFFL